MPASGGDPVTAALRLSLTASQNCEDNVSLDKRLVASTARVLLTRIEYEPAGNCLGNVLNDLKNKYIVLKNQDISKNGADKTSSSTNSKLSVNSIGSNHIRDMKPQPDSILPSPKVTLFPAERVQLGWRGSHFVGAGMINVGNSCYLNSTLQALFHVPSLVNWLYSDSHHVSNCSVPNGTISGECVNCAMSKTLKASQTKACTIIKPFLIYNKLRFICKHLVHGQQEDAHEFMRYLLESMEKAYLARFKGNKLDSYSKETTPLNQIFGGYVRTEVTCLQCGGISTTFQHCQDLLLDIRRASTLDDALSAYFCKERLDGDDAYRCERCHKKVSATKKFSIEKPPQVLCIQLKRFSIVGGKINKHVSFTQRLDITRFLCPQSAYRGPVPLTYRLVSIVTHVGSSVHCGHYTAVAQTSTGQYYQFDDSLVRPISLQAVMDTNAYIMMYEREPRLPPKASSSQQSVPSATATTSTCTLNGQKSGLGIRNQLVQGAAPIPVHHKMGPSVNNKPSSLNLTNHKQGSDINSTSIPSSYTAPSPLPPAKERDRVVFGLHQPAASPAPPRLVMHIKNGKVCRPPPQPSPQQQEPSASTTASLAASLVPYCESGEDESSSSDSEEPPTRLWDMPSLGEVIPSPNPKPVPVSSKVSTKTSSKRNLSCIAGIDSTGSKETVSLQAAVSNQNISSSCVTFNEDNQVKPSDVNRISISNSECGNLSCSPGKSKKDDEAISSLNVVSTVLHEKCKNDKMRTDKRDTYFQNKNNLTPDKSLSENYKPKKVDIGFPSRSRTSSVSPSKSNEETLDSRRADNFVRENFGNKTTTFTGISAPKIRQNMDVASSKEVTNYNIPGNLQVNTNLSTNRGKLNAGWQVTDLLLHSPSVASESSTSSCSVATSTTDWAVSDVKNKYGHVSRKDKTLTGSDVTVSLCNSIPPNKEVKFSQNEPDDNKRTLWKTNSDSALLKSDVEGIKHLVNGDTPTKKYDSKSDHSKKRKSSGEDSSYEEVRIPSLHTDWTKSKDARDSDIETKEYSRKHEKKRRKLKKHKKKERPSGDNNDGSAASIKEDEDGCYEWVEKTHETLGLNSSYHGETNGHCWDGTRKPDVANHLSHLSHRGYGTANVTTWSGERSRMEEEIERDRKEHRKRSYDNSYDEEFDRGRVKKMKQYRLDLNHNKVKYNPFQDYHNYKHQWGNSGGFYHKPYYRNGNNFYNHYNNHHPRHKQFNGRNNGYHNGNKYHNHFNKRDHWRH